jgi:transcriptional regulator with AAA-type ATPase domain/NAD-dependent dihydropyrimidine dehydrogenase PreA subunit
MNQIDLVTWLQEKTALNILERKVLEVFVPLLEKKIIAAEETIVSENDPVDGLYILKSGQIESKSQKTRYLGWLPGTVINLQALLLKQLVQNTVVTLSECEFYFIEPDIFRQFITRYPEIDRAFSQYLAAELQQLSSQLNLDRERQIILRPYLVNKAKRGIIGKSRYAIRLRSDIKQASRSHQSVLIFGERGLEKDDIAALIHFGSSLRQQSIVKIDCSKIQTSGAELFGRTGGKSGLIEALGEGTLVFNNIQELDPQLRPAIANLLATNRYFPIDRDEENPAEEKISQARIILISEQVSQELDTVVGMTIKVPPLRVRKTDIEDHVNYYLNLICRSKKLNKSRVTPEALRRLQSYDFPNNLRELETLIERAITQLSGCGEITEEIIWQSQSKKRQFRFNLLDAYPNLRYFLRSSWWTDRINYGFTLTFFAFIVGILFLAPQTRDSNFALNFFWDWWWCGILIAFPFVGRLWCSVCPFMIYGELTQKISLILFPRQLKKWPRQTADKWGGWFLFALFALILIWEEVWDLQNTAYLSAWLLLLITGGAMVCSAIFERRFWCRYLCPIGGMNGLFAKLSMTELRAQQGICSAECNTYQCYKGGVQKGEGLETMGCPLYSHPAQLEDNKDCVLCMTCLKACPHRSVELNLRPPAIELWTSHVPHGYEVALLLLLLNNVFLHHLPELLQRLNLRLNLEQFWTHLIVAIVVLSLPTTITFFAHLAMKLLYRFQSKTKPRKFVYLAYGYLPLVLAGNLAHYLHLGLGEAGKILPVTLATFGLDGGNLPVFVLHPATISFLQITVLVFGVLASIIITQKIARQPFRLLLPQHLAIVITAILMGWAIFTSS